MGRFFLPAILTGILLFLAIRNYTPGTLLTGWDTLHPEFNFPLAFTRAINGVWRFDQGLGAVAGHSHMAELPRLFLLSLFNLILPIPIIRYAFFFLCLLAGILGMYAFIDSTTRNKTIAFLSSLTYLANLGTAQIFIVPFEMFAVQYAMLPWILLTAKTYLAEASRRNLVLFFITIIIASPMAYAATLWYALFVCFAAFAFLFAGKKHVRRSLFLIGATLLLNLYWILPNVYFTIYHAKEVQESKINQLFSPEIFAKNQEFGTMRDAPLLKSFLFDWQLFNTKTNQFEQVMAVWQTHLNNPIVAGFGYLVFGVSILGIVKTIQQRNKMGITMLPFLVIPFFLLLNGTYPINRVFDALGEISPVIKEAIRVPFTKFSILYMMALSFYLARGIAVFKLASKYIVIIFSIFSLWYFLPAFGGNLIHPAMRATIPNEYFEMFRWFQQQPTDERVAILPIHTFWGWTYYSWGYQGAGFLQFGIPQPIMDRDYNRWSPFNERYHQEMSYAIYSQNPKIIADVLAKYHIQWVLLDRSVISPGNTDASLLTWHIPALLTQIRSMSLVKKFGNDLIVYRVIPKQPEMSTVLPNITLNDRYTGPVIEPPIATFPGHTYTSTDTPTKDHVDLPALRHDQAYVVSIVNKNVSGFPLQLCISNNLTGHCDLFTHLEKNSSAHTERFILPPLSDYGTGYTINFNNFTITGQTTINEVSSIAVSKADWSPQPSKPTEAEITNNQSFEPGWIAWDGKQLLPHVLVNNWANAWLVEPKSADQAQHEPSTNSSEKANAKLRRRWNGNTIYIFFLPQLLEWIGFILIPLPFLAIIGYDRIVCRKVRPLSQRSNRTLKPKP